MTDIIKASSTPNLRKMLPSAPLLCVTLVLLFTNNIVVAASSQVTIDRRRQQAPSEIFDGDYSNHRSRSHRNPSRLTLDNHFFHRDYEDDRILMMTRKNSGNTYNHPSFFF